MDINTEEPSAGRTLVEFDRLSKGIDRILERWTGDDRPTKLTLLNDLAAAIRPGSNWGALKANQQSHQHLGQGFNTNLIPKVDRSAEQFPARLTEVRYDQDSIELAYLIEEIRPLFGMLYSGDPIIGLELNAVEGNGYSEASIYAKVIVNSGGAISVAEAYASDLDPVVARLVYNAIQNLNSIDFYPTMAQGDCRSLRVIVGPFDCVLSIPEYYAGKREEDFASQGLRVLLDEGKTPSITDLDIALRLASASIPLLGLKQLGDLESVRFKLSQPLMQVWEPVEFSAPDLLDDRPMFWIPDGEYWTHQDDYLLDHNIWTHSTLGEPLDLALALIDIDDLDVYLKVSLTPMPKQSRKSSELKANWRGGFHRSFQVLRIRRGQPTEELRLSDTVRKRFETGLIGWAIHEGHEVVENQSHTKTEALIRRDVRRASQHLRQVEAIMNGADPTDIELLRRIRHGKEGRHED